MMTLVLSLLGLFATLAGVYFTVRRSRRTEDVHAVYVIELEADRDITVEPGTSLDQLMRGGAMDDLNTDDLERVEQAVGRIEADRAAGRDITRVTRTTTEVRMPSWTFVILRADDAERYRCEWGAHLWELIQAGEIKAARRDRRRMIRAVFWLAVVIRVHNALTRAHVR